MEIKRRCGFLRCDSCQSLLGSCERVYIWNKFCMQHIQVVVFSDCGANAWMLMISSRVRYISNLLISGFVDFWVCWFLRGPWVATSVRQLGLAGGLDNTLHVYIVVLKFHEPSKSKRVIVVRLRKYKCLLQYNGGAGKEYTLQLCSVWLFIYFLFYFYFYLRILRWWWADALMVHAWESTGGGGLDQWVTGTAIDGFSGTRAWWVHGWI